MEQTAFMQKNKNQNTGREDILTFNPSQAPNKLPNYVMKEGAYGDYSTSLGAQKNYVNQVSDGSNWNSNLKKVAQEVETGKQSQNTQKAYNNTNQTINNLSNTLRTQPQQRNIQEGYTTADLNQMAQNGFNTLNEGYQNALNKAAANYNRLGLRGSGFEIADEFGNQTDSITSNYLKNVQQLQNDIASKGLEAAREDRYKNADANDAQYQQWIQNQGNLAGLQQGFADKQNANDLSWLQNMQDVAFKNKDYLTKAIDVNRALSEQSDEQQRNWANINGGLAKEDDSSVMKRWEGAVDVDKTRAANQFDVYKTILQTLGVAATGDKDNYSKMITELNQKPEWIKTMVDSLFNSDNQ